MKTYILTIILGTFLSISYAQIFQESVPDDYGYCVQLGQTVPDFTILLPDGTTIPISDLQGKVVMLQFTASWCGVCHKEMPHIEQDIWQKHKNNPNFALYGIDLKEDTTTISAFKGQTGVSYPITLDPHGKIFHTFAQRNAGVTRNIILDKNGKIVFLTRLYKEEEFNKMCEVIEALLSK